MLHTGSIHGRLEPITEDPEDLEDLEEAPSLMVPSAKTPRYSALLKKLNSAEDLTILDDLASFTVHDKLLYKRPYGSAEQPDDEPYALAERFEHLLRVTDEQRQLHLERLEARKDTRDRTANMIVFNANDMREIFNAWRNHPETWCDNLQSIRELPTPQQRHLALKSKFNTMLFQLMGEKALAETFIKFPISCTDQPAPILRRFADAWKTWRTSPERNNAREVSTKKEKRDPDRRLGAQKYWLIQRQKSAVQINDWLQKNCQRWDQLSREDQQIWNEFRDGKIWEAIDRKCGSRSSRHLPEEQPRRYTLCGEKSERR